ncbi:MAG TPA: ERCC4 domain-containing protein [Candidatus Dormibacteraeota bacterium]
MGEGPGRASGAFVIGRNPSPSSRLLYVLRLPVAREGDIVLATRETWPRGRDAFCYQLQAWPNDAEVIDEVPIEGCWRTGAAVHLVLRRPRDRRAMFVWTQSKGHPVIFWRSPTTMGQARPGIRLPQARGLEAALDIAIDRGERYPWKFSRYAVTTSRRRLPAGDYAVLDESRVVAVVERKTVSDLASSAGSGTLNLTLADLSQAPHSALVVEGRLSDLVKAGTKAGVRPGWLLNLIAALQVEHPAVAWMFAETRALAEDWAYRWLAASLRAERGLAQPLLRAAETEPSAAPSALSGLEERAPLFDAEARRHLIVREAAAGVRWTTRLLARRAGVTAATASKDLKSAASEGVLISEKVGRETVFARGKQQRTVD